MNGYLTTRTRKQFFSIYDLLFVILAALFAYLCLKGMMAVSASGAILDSDLQTYAQGMAGAAQPQNFQGDPVLGQISAANSIPNLERLLAGWLASDANYGEALLRAGACAIFVFYAGWYLLGKYVFSHSSLAAILSLLAGVTVWIGWGTFWGVTHSDPVPRVFFAALWPLLLLLALFAIKASKFRPLCMFAAGLAMWVHGISALNCGAMFFMAFALLKPQKAALAQHLGNLFLCLLAFFVPVLIFLWPSLTQAKNFSAAELALFREVFDLRWHEDYANFWPRLLNFLDFSNLILPLFLCGTIGWFVTLFMGTPREKLLCRMIPPFLLALCCVTGFCWAESHYAPQLGRLPMGHELVRGLRFAAPLSWLMIVAAFGCVAGKTIRRLTLLVVLGVILVFNVDRQYMGFQYAVWEYTGLKLPLLEKALEEKNRADSYAELMADISRIVPPGEAIFSNGEDMAIRYLAKRPLIYTFKDGYVHFYNKDFDSSAKWLEYARLMRAEKDIDAWLLSGAPWFLNHSSVNKAALEKYGTVVLEKDGWQLVHRKNEG